MLRLYKGQKVSRLSAIRTNMATPYYELQIDLLEMIHIRNVFPSKSSFRLVLQWTMEPTVCSVASPSVPPSNLFLPGPDHGWAVALAATYVPGLASAAGRYLFDVTVLADSQSKVVFL